MSSPPRLLISVGIFLIILGLLWGLLGQLGGRFSQLGRLPGDIVIERQNVRFYFPIVTSILLSLFLSLLAYAFRYFSKK